MENVVGFEGDPDCATQHFRDPINIYEPHLEE